MQKINAYITPFVVFVLLGIVAYDHFYKPAPETPVAVHDAVAVQLGKNYRAKAVDILGAQFAAVKNGTFTDLDALTKAQRDALDAALVAAYTPVAAELEKRFGKAEDPTNPASVAVVKGFFDDVEHGYNGGK